MENRKILVDKDYLDMLLADLQATMSKLDLATGKQALEIAEHAQYIAECRLERIRVLEGELNMMKSIVDDVYGYGTASRWLSLKAAYDMETPKS